MIAIFDVIHNPPLLVSPEEPIELSFELVCPDEPCRGARGTLRLLDQAGNESKYELSDDDGDTVMTLELPSDLLDQGSVEYSASFSVEGGPEPYQWPLAGATQAVLHPFVDPFVVDLDKASHGLTLDDGEEVFHAPWGSGDGELGLDTQAMVGPTSFDVAAGGTVVVVDTENDRLVRGHPDGSNSEVPMDTRGDFVDLAVAPDGGYSILYPNGRGSRVPYVDRFDRSGKLIDSIPTLDPWPQNLRYMDGQLRIERGQGAMTTAVASGDKASSASQQASSAAVGLQSRGARIVLKHFGDHQVGVLKETPAGSFAWLVKSEQNLGPMAMAHSSDSGVVLVQSTFTEKISRYVALNLAVDPGAVRATELPNERLVDVTAGSEFRVSGGHVYAARSSERGFSVHRYDLDQLTEGD